MQAAALLEREGYDGLVDNRCGFAGARDYPGGPVTEPGWAAEGLPVATEPEAGRSHEALTSG